MNPLTTSALMFGMGMMLGVSLLLAAMQVGRRRRVAALTDLLNRGELHLASQDGGGISAEALFDTLDQALGKPATAAQRRRRVILSVAVACLAAAAGFLITVQP